MCFFDCRSTKSKTFLYERHKLCIQIINFLDLLKSTCLKSNPCTSFAYNLFVYKIAKELFQLYFSHFTEENTFIRYVTKFEKVAQIFTKFVDFTKKYH